MKLSTLSLFVEVMQHRSFSEVAHLHNVAPSSISRSITALEAELGIRLFQRSTRKLEATQEGILYFERVAPLLDELQSAQQMAVDISKEPQGTLRVTASVVFGQQYIVPLLPALAVEYPDLAIDLILTDAYLDLIEDRIDVAIRLGTLPDSTHIARRLKTMRFYICASPEYIEKHDKPETPAEISKHNCLLFPRNGHDLNWLLKDKQGEVHETPVHGKYLITNSQAIRQSVKAGLGLAMLPDWLIKEDLQSGSLVSIFDDYEVTATDFESAIWMLYPSREYLPLKTRIFMDHLQESFNNDQH